MRPTESMATATRALTASLDARRPKLGEQTSEQGSRSNFNGLFGGSSNAEMPGFDKPKAGTFKLYREISSHPTTAEVMQIVLSPIRTNSWGYKIREGTPDEIVEFYQQQMDGIRSDFVRDVVQAVSLGFAPFEPIYAADGRRIIIERMKPLAQENTDFIADESTGKIVGLENRSPRRDPVKLYFKDRKAFAYTYDGACGNPYGRSRHENIRADHGRSEQIGERIAQYIKKISGVISTIHYPDGESKDAAGATRPNFWLAKNLADAMARGESLIFPNGFADTDNIKLAYELAGKSQWIVDAIDLGGVDYLNGLLAALAYYDKRLFRGWLRSERVGLEGQHGMRADAQNHSDTGIKDSELIDADIAAALSKGIGDELLVMNFGEGARGAVAIQPAPIADNATQNGIEIVKVGLANPLIAPGLARKINWDETLEDIDIPVDEDAKGPIEVSEAAQPDAANAGNASAGSQKVRERLTKAGHSPELIDKLLKKKGKAA